MWREKFAEVLRKDFESLKSKNPRFSLRAYAKKIELGIGPLSEILKQKNTWKLTPQRARLILDKISVRPSVKNSLLVQMGEKTEHTKRTLAAADYSILTNWYYYPILFAFDLPEPHCLPENIARRLGISKAKVLTIAEDLLQRRLLEKDASGNFVRPTEYIQTSDDSPAAQDGLKKAIHVSHQMNLRVAGRALDQLPTERRDFTSLTFVGSEKRIAELKAEIRSLYEKASSIMNAETDNDHVFRLSVQLFPVEFDDHA